MMDREELLALPEVAALRDLPNVIDVGFGMPTVNGLLRDELAIIVTVKDKVPLGDLPKAAVIPKQVAAFPTDVALLPNPEDFQIGNGPPEDRKRVRPMLLGVAVSNVPTATGTLGFFARRNSDNKPVLVSNYHILYRDRALPAVAGTPHVALQPPVGTFNTVGTVEGGGLPGAVDAAFAVIGEEGSSCCCRSAIKYENKTRNTQTSGPSDSVQLVGVKRVSDQEIVAKTGRTSGKTFGKVVTANLTNLPAQNYTAFNLPAGNSFTFASVIEIASFDPTTNTMLDSVAFTEPGDSGSAVYNMDGEIIGLHFLSMFNAAQNKRRSYAFHIEDVEAALGITVGGTRTGLAAPPPPAGPLAALSHQFDPAEDEFLIGGTTFPRAGVDLVAESLDAALRATSQGQTWREIFERHHYEVLRQVNRKRGVTLAWQRSAGPAWLAALVRSAQRPDYALPDQIDGTSAMALAQAMRAALYAQASPELCRDLDRYGDQLEALIGQTQGARQGVDLLARTHPAELESADAG